MTILSVDDFNRLIAGDLLRITRTATFSKIFVRQNSLLSASEFASLSAEFTQQLKCSAAQGEAFFILMLHYLGITFEPSSATPMQTPVNVLDSNITKRSFTKEECKAVLHAIKQGDLEAVTTYVKEGFDIEYKHRSQRTAILVAAHENKTALVEYLISVGANVNAEDTDHETALSLAIKNRNEQLIDQLLPISNVRSLDVSLYACNKHDPDPLLIQKLIAAGADPHSTKIFLPSPIKQAINMSKTSLMEAYIAGSNAVGRTLNLDELMEEMLKWHPNISLYQLFIREGASKTYLNANGRSLISLAVTYNDISLEYNNSLDTYAEPERLSMITLLVQEGIDINQSDYLGRTPLHYGVSENNPSLVSLLIRLGADLGQQDVYQKSPLQYATEKRYKELLAIMAPSASPVSASAPTVTVPPASTAGRKILLDDH